MWPIIILALTLTFPLAASANECVGCIENVWWVKMLRQEALDQIRTIVKEECQPTLVCTPTLVCEGGDLSCLDDEDTAIASLKTQCEARGRVLLVRQERHGGFKIACRRLGSGNRNGDSFPCLAAEAVR